MRGEAGRQGEGRLKHKTQAAAEVGEGHQRQLISKLADNVLLYLNKQNKFLAYYTEKFAFAAWPDGN